MAVLVHVGQRRDVRGVVVDLCPACAELQPHWFCHMYAGLAVNTVPVDPGMYAGSSIVCFRCSRTSEVSRKRYATSIPVDVAAKTALADGLRQTNPVLADAISAVDQARAAGAPPTLLEAVEALLFARRELGAIAPELSTWPTLSEAARASVTAKTEQLWRAAGSPPRPTTPIEPGMPGWASPANGGSILRSIDRGAVLVALALLGCFAALVGLAELAHC